MEREDGGMKHNLDKYLTDSERKWWAENGHRYTRDYLSELDELSYMFPLTDGTVSRLARRFAEWLLVITSKNN